MNVRTNSGKTKNPANVGLDYLNFQTKSHQVVFSNTLLEIVL